MLTGVLASVIALGAATAFGVAWRVRNGRMRVLEADGVRSAAAHSAARVLSGGLTEADLGTSLGSRATLVQFSSEFCAPCRATRRVLADVAAALDGVTHVEIDAGSRLDLVRRLDVRRTPTTFVLGPDGHVTHRASGEPRTADVSAAIGSVL